MPRRLSSIAPDWWDYTTLDDDIIHDAAALTPEKMVKLSRPGFKVVMYDSIEDFYLAEALEYITAWKQSTPDNPVGICGPIGPTEQLPLVARLVNDLRLNVRSAHFWGRTPASIGSESQRRWASRPGSWAGAAKPQVAAGAGRRTCECPVPR